MIFHRLGLVNKNQMGFTLGELMLAIAISGIITGGITMTIFQVIEGNIRTSNHMTAVRQVQNAGYWVSHDAQMAQIVDATSGFPLTLTWTDWEGHKHQVTYTWKDMSGSGLKNLQRSYSIDGTNTETGIIAQYVNPTGTSCQFVGGKLTFRVTATVQQQSETRVYDVIPRPG